MEMEQITIRTRHEIKVIAKEGITKQRDTAMGAIFLVFTIVHLGVVLDLAFPDILITSLITIATLFFVDSVLYVNLAGVYAKIFRGETTSAGEIISGFGTNYLRKASGMLLVWTFTFMWSILLFIPGIIRKQSSL